MRENLTKNKKHALSLRELCVVTQSETKERGAVSTAMCICLQMINTNHKRKYLFCFVCEHNTAHSFTKSLAVRFNVKLIYIVAHIQPTPPSETPLSISVK